MTGRGCYRVQAGGGCHFSRLFEKLDAGPPRGRRKDREGDDQSNNVVPANPCPRGRMNNVILAYDIRSISGKQRPGRNRYLTLFSYAGNEKSNS